MRRRELTGIIALASLVARYESSAAQTTPRTIRLAYLAPIRIPHLVEALTGGLRDLGYVEGQNLSIEYRFAGENPEHFDLLAIELVKLAPQVIVTVATPATLAAGRATSSIPIVVATAGDLVRSGAVQSLARPGGNVTGVTLYSVELSKKRLEVLREAIPTVRRVGVLGNANNSITAYNGKTPNPPQGRWDWSCARSSLMSPTWRQSFPTWEKSAWTPLSFCPMRPSTRNATELHDWSMLCVFRLCMMHVSSLRQVG